MGKKNESYSDLENLILAMIAVGANSGYAMRKHLQRMRGIRWSTESGSIYRALERLLKAGLIKVAGKAGSPNRQRTEYAVTQTGGQFCQRWLTARLTDEELEGLDDITRTKGHFLELVSPQERVSVVRAWKSDSKRLLKALAAENQLAGGMYSDQTMRCYKMMLKCRIDWLSSFEKDLKASSGK